MIQLDAAAIRRKIAFLERSQCRAAWLWKIVRRQALAAPQEHAWWLPLVAVATGDTELHAAAKSTILSYLDCADEGGLSGGVQFQNWCWAFPHARWSQWFDLLRRSESGREFWPPEEAEETAARFLLAQFTDYHTGWLVKPYPECVDNQTASLCLSSLLIGTLFRDWPGTGELAKALSEEALSRSQVLIGGMPPSGYSGEGSGYQSPVVAVTVPFLVELWERHFGGDWFHRPLPPHGTSAHDVLRMTARCHMPGGLMLPWDDYGYTFGPKAPLVYLARRTGEVNLLRLLEREINWQAGWHAGWGYDDIVWCLLHWPEDLETEPEGSPQWASWASDDVGGVLVNASGSRYLMQMWDKTDALPIREHVNPNALVLAADGIPLSADGAVAEGFEEFHYDDTWREVHYLGLGASRSNYGKACGGAHNIILVDGWEGLRPLGEFEPQRLEYFDAESQTLCGDVTGLYRSAYPDVQRILRRSRLIDDTFWLVEDFAHFQNEHDFTSRWYFRPEVHPVPGGCDLQTREGMTLSMRALLGTGKANVQRINGCVRVMDGTADRVDFQMRGNIARWLWLLWATPTRQVWSEIAQGWRAWPGDADALPQEAWEQPESSTFSILPDGQPWHHAEVSLCSSWWFFKTVSIPGEGEWWLVLPRGLPSDARLWLDDTEIDFADVRSLQGLLPTHVPCPQALKGCRQMRVTLWIPYVVGHYPKAAKFAENAIPDGPIQILVPIQNPDKLVSACFQDSCVSLQSSSGRQWKLKYSLLEGEIQWQ